MASDVGRLLTEKFMASLQAAQSENSGLKLGLESIFEDIKDCVEMNEEKIWYFPASSLYDLNDELAECLISVHHCRKLKKNLFCLKYFSRFYLLWQKNKIKNRLSAVKSKLDDLLKEDTSPIKFCLTNFWKDPDTRFEEDCACASKIIGLGGYEEKIMGWLSDNGFKAIGICGMGGSGKTALITQVLSSTSVCEKYSPIIRVCFSDIYTCVEVDIEGKIVKHSEMLDVQEVIVKCMLEKLKYDIDGLTKDFSYSELLEILNLLLMSKKYLIVMEDVWHRNDWYKGLATVQEDDRMSDLFWHALPKDTGGAVIISSRIKEVAEEMVGMNLINLEPLNEDTCRELILHIIKEENLVTLENTALRNIMDDAVHQCHGLPLAAKTLAKIVHKQVSRTQSLKKFIATQQGERQSISKEDVLVQPEMEGTSTRVEIQEIEEEEAEIVEGDSYAYQKTSSI
ncbi:Disease resistance protein [Quillaja saponaria]|uniref:Disease resistance protein n=1 Tax=Quillaja saponaria TaxID=32244 RepID=A0AAD7VF37_QUISA|nr:Disease resistance protein [Quillaja saponaria]